MPFERGSVTFSMFELSGELPEDLLDWLNHPSEDLKRTIEDLRSA